MPYDFRATLPSADEKFSPVALYSIENIIYMEYQKYAPRHRGHVDFRECTPKRYFPVVVFPIENIIYIA